MSNYEILPFSFKAERAEIISDMIRKIAASENLFSSHLPECEEDPSCLKDKVLEQMCPRCVARMKVISRALSASDTRVWEVWASLPSDAGLVGVIYFSDIVAGSDATGHYVFFDHKLSDKTEIVEEAITEMFKVVPRLTIEIPKPFVVLARHAHAKLGFGGGFDYTLKGGTPLRVEGVKRKAVTWKDEPTDLLVLGRLRDH